MNYQTEGVILKSFSSGEFDRIYWIFSKDRGKFNFTAKGARKPLAKLAGGLEPLTQAEIFLVQGKKIDRVVGVVALSQFEKIRDNLEKNLRARSILELLFYLEMDSSEAEKIYFQLTRYLFELNKEELPLRKIDLLSLGVLWKIIFLSGWGVDFFRCSGCGEKLQREKKNYFCFCRGIICEDCLKKTPGSFLKLPIEKDIVKLLRFFIQQELLFCKKLNLSQNLTFTLKKLTKAYLDEIIGKKMLDLWF